MDGFEGSLVKFVNKILPSTAAKDQLVNLLAWALIVLNTMAIVLFLIQALTGDAATDFASYAAFYVVRFTLAVLMIIGALLMKKRALLGWRLAFYPLLASLLINIIVLNILGMILHCFFVYSLIQVREIHS
jgi:hypothetical protein